jgi:hypothetical protein
LARLAGPALADAMKINQSLLTLNLWSSRIGNDGAAAMAAALRIEKIRC